MFFLPHQTIKHINYICVSLLKLFEIAINWVSLMTTPPGRFSVAPSSSPAGRVQSEAVAYDGRRGSFVWQIEEALTDDYPLVN